MQKHQTKCAEKSHASDECSNKADIAKFEHIDADSLQETPMMKEPNNGEIKSKYAETITEKDSNRKEDSSTHNALSLIRKWNATSEEQDYGGDVKRRYMPDGYPDFRPMPELCIPHWSYTMDNIIHEYLEGTEYTVCDFVKGKVDENGHPFVKEIK